MDSNSKKPRPARRRARKPDGSFKGDDPSTPRNEAWEATDIAEGLPGKSIDYSVKQKVQGTSQDTSGKYGKKDKVRPTFGKVTTVYN